MRIFIKKLLHRMLPSPIIKFISNIINSLDFAYITSYSQEGEDMILKEIFHNNKGFFVDVGSNHPLRYSNTNYFYKKGWHGINIDAMPGSMEIFNHIRQRDLNLEVAISDTKEVMKFYVFKETAVNTFSKNLAEERIKLNIFGYLYSCDIQTESLSEVLKKHLPENQKIDFLTVDVEGFDLNVLKSNNWEKYRPLVILIEDIEFSFEKCSESNVYVFLKQQGYKIIAKTINTLIFVEESYKYNIYE